MGMLTALKGYRTYICAGLGALVVLAHFLGFESADTANTLLGLLGFAGLAALRAAV